VCAAAAKEGEVVIISCRQPNPEKLVTLAFDFEQSLVYDGRYGCFQFLDTNAMLRYIDTYFSTRDYECITLQKIKAHEEDRAASPSQ
jgi:hypothetical protein